MLDGAVDHLAFETYVARVLVPELRPGDTVIMDNLPAHKGSRVAALIEAAGARLLHLPPYSPDFNPIENAFAKLKTLRGFTPYEFICQAWTKQPKRFRLVPSHNMLGPNRSRHNRNGSTGSDVT